MSPSYIPSFYQAIANGEYQSVINYLEVHGVDEYGEYVFKTAVARRAAPIIKALLDMGFDFLSVEEAKIDDELADVLFGDPDKAVDRLTEDCSEAVKKFVVARQMEYHLDPIDLMVKAKSHLKPYYLMSMV